MMRSVKLRACSPGWGDPPPPLASFGEGNARQIPVFHQREDIAKSPFRENKLPAPDVLPAAPVAQQLASARALKSSNPENLSQ